MADYPIVDIHTHLFRTPEIGRRAFWRDPHPAVIPYTGLPEDHLAGMAEAGVAYAAAMIVTPTREMRQRILAQHDEDAGGLALDQQLLDRMDRNNVWGCQVARRHPAIVPFIMIDPDLLAGDALANYVRNRREEGARGVKLLPVQTHHHGDDKRLFAMYEYMESVNMPVFSQSGGGVGIAQNGVAVNPVTGDAWGRPGRFAEVVATFPRLNVVLAHALGGYNGSMGDLFGLVDRYEHVFVDTTVVTPRVGANVDRAHELARLARRVGPEHIAFGTNFPLAEFDHDRTRDIDIWRQLPLLSDEEKRLILSTNGMRIVHGTEDVAVPAA